jgi:hypothetical protein
MINLKHRETEYDLESFLTEGEIDSFYDILFETSIDIRRNILHFLIEKLERMNYQ